MPRSSTSEKYNSKLVFIQTVFWLLVLISSLHFFVTLTNLHWPKVMAALYPSAVPPIAFEATPEATLPAPPATISATLINDLIQAILATNATSSSTATQAATPAAQPTL